MKYKFVLATHNPGKLAEMGAILSGLGVEVVSPADLGITVDVEETGSTFCRKRHAQGQGHLCSGRNACHCR